MLFFFFSPTVVSCCRLRNPGANLSSPAAPGTPRPRHQPSAPRPQPGYRAGEPTRRSAQRSPAAGSFTKRYPTCRHLLWGGGEPGTSHAPAGDAVPGSGGALAAVTCGAQRGAVAAPPPRLSVARGSGSGCRRRRGGLGRGPRPGVSLSFPPPPPPRRRFP